MKHPEKTELTKQDIVEAFWHFYAVKPIEKVTVREVIEKAGYNRATFYHHFADVYDVRQYVEDRIVQDVAGSFPEQAMNAEGLFDPEVLEPFFQAVYIKNERYLQTLLGDHGDPAFVDVMRQSIERHCMQVLTALGVDPDDTFGRYLLEFYSSCWLSALRMHYKAEAVGVEVDIMDLYLKIGENVIVPLALSRTAEKDSGPVR